MKTNSTVNNINTFRQAFCAATAYSIGLIISLFFKTDHTYWIPMTIGLMFSIPMRGMIIQRSSDRFFGTVIGLIVFFFYANILLYSDYRWIYLAPVIFFFMMYPMFVTKNYTLCVIFITVFVSLPGIVLTKDQYFPLNLTIAERFVYTIVGIVITILCEFTIYKYSSLVTGKYKKAIRRYFYEVGDLLLFCNESFVNDTVLKMELRNKLQNLTGKIGSIESIYPCTKHEYEYYEDKKRILFITVKYIYKIEKELNKIIYILENNSFDKKTVNRNEFINLSNSISSLYKNAVNGFHKNISTDNILQELSDVIVKAKEPESSTSSYLYLIHLKKITLLLTELLSEVKQPDIDANTFF